MESFNLYKNYLVSMKKISVKLPLQKQMILKNFFLFISSHEYNLKAKIIANKKKQKLKFYAG